MQGHSANHGGGQTDLLGQIALGCMARGTQDANQNAGPDKIKKEKRFEIVYQEGGFMSAKTIYVDKETGVNYLFIVSGYAGGLTPLLDAEGKPVVTQETAD